MKNRILYLPVHFFLFILVKVLSMNVARAQTEINHFITRGADTAEIFFTTYWYWSGPDSDQFWGGNFRSIDNGQNLTLQYKFDWMANRHEIFGDSSSGTIYLHHYGSSLDTLMVSHDYGSSFERKYIEEINKGIIASGCRKGEFYCGVRSWENRGLAHFDAYGDSVSIMSLNADSIHVMDVGTQCGELYAMQWPYYMDTIGIAFSNNFGRTFSIFYQDTGLLVNLHRYTFSRGTVPGELYMVAQDIATDEFHVFHSIDYGHTLELKSITQPMSINEYDISFTAGRTPGSFYILKVDRVSYYHAMVWIFHSADYGESFTTQFHSLDSLLTHVDKPIIHDRINIFPNPASDKLTLQTDHRSVQITIELMDMTGRVCLRKEFRLPGETPSFDISRLQEGMYVLRCKTESNTILTEKLVVRRY